MLKEQNTSVCILKSDKTSYFVGLKGGTLPCSTVEKCYRSISPLLTSTWLVRVQEPLLAPVILPSTIWLGQYGFTPVESGLAAEPSMKWVERTSLLQTPMPRQPQHPLPCVTPPCEQFRGARSSPESISEKKHAQTSTVDSQEIQSRQIFILWPFLLKRVIEKTTATKTWVCTSLQ